MDSTVRANEFCPAKCWTTGQKITAGGYTSDKRGRLLLNAGGSAMSAASA
ncbi:hypothetical protein [Streptomyces cavernae]|nr:hypothetical protein [Streptomyces cavernae]